MSVRAIAAPKVGRFHGPLMAIAIILLAAPGDARGQPAPTGVLLVDGSLTSPGDGLTWSSAYKYLNDAIADAAPSAGFDH